jgi:adenylate cyclase
MSDQLNGELVPVGGGDTIPLIREILTVGRRPSCDIRLPFPDVSGTHCEFIFRSGYWYVRDLNSTNGVKVNGVRVQEKQLHPKDEVSIGRKRRFTILYAMPSDSRQALDEEPEEDILSQTLLQRAGLEKFQPKDERSSRKGRPPAKVDPNEISLRRPRVDPDDEDD